MTLKKVGSALSDSNTGLSQNILRVLLVSSLLILHSSIRSLWRCLSSFDNVSMNSSRSIVGLLVFGLIDYETSKY